ncbi:hypothetical protein EJ04DRAFT_562825 [Polyplosphaeria fusca]|uniref:DUF4211 domain-containing protein n=1 Tax=Polyplosphaeria fusca TaxID=682080 RepID=A0A9P4R033_9PLEO|nr:hypothetical protein EJ04DRAFT_562825 [Polyplosphaeria fusca]
MPPKGRKRQARLTFSPTAASFAAEQLSPQVREKAASVRLDKTSGRPSKQRRVVDSDSDDPIYGPSSPSKVSQTEEERQQYKRGMRMGMPVLNPKQGMFGTFLDDDDDSSPQSDSSSSINDEQRQLIPTTPRKKANSKVSEKSKAGDKTPKRTRRHQPILSDTESDKRTAHTVMRTRAAKKANTENKESVDADSVVGPRTPTPQPQESDSGESENMPDTTPLRKIRRQTTLHRKSDSFEVSDGEVDEDVTPKASRRLLSRRASESEEEEDIGEEMSRSSSRRLEKEQEDLEQDLDFLTSSPPADKGRLRSSQAKPLTTRERALEELKKKRRASSVPILSPATPARRGNARVVDESESDLEIEDENNEGEMEIDQQEEEDEIDEQEEEDETEDSSSVEDDERLHTNFADVFNENDNDAEFIDDNDDDLIGEPDEMERLPVHYSSLARAKPSKLFKFAIEWMVQKKINPAFRSTDDIYMLAFKKLNDEVNGLVNSKFSSSVWTPDFTRALRARPEVSIEGISRSTQDVEDLHCEACNRKKHPATFSVQFGGQPYDEQSLEPLAYDSSSETDESASDGEKPIYNENGERIPAESRVFTLGSTCKANAQMAHTLRHWRHHLNNWVINYLKGKGHLNAPKLVERDSWSIKERGKCATNIVDDMEASGEIRKLYKLYKDQINFAVTAANEYRFGWGRRE